MEDRAYTVTTLAMHWDCSPDEVYRLLRTRRLKGFKLGSAWRITKEAVKEYEGMDFPEPNRFERHPQLTIR